MEICNKCGTTMFGVSGASIPSTMYRNGERSERIEGWSCWRCGTWIEGELTPIISGVPEVPPHLVRPKGPRPKLNLTNSQKYGKELAETNKAAVEKHIKLITRRRKEGVNWESITDEFCMKANVDMTDNTLRRYCRTVMPPELMMSLKFRKGA